MKHHLQCAAFFVLAGTTLVFINGCKSNQKIKMEKELTAFIQNYESKAIPLTKEANIAYWNASISGKDEDYKKSEKLNIQLTAIYSNKDEFAKLKKIKESNAVTDPVLKRQLDVLYNSFLSNQADTAKLNQMIKMQTEIEKKYSNFRAEVKGKKLNDNDIETILKKSVKSDECREAWLAHKNIGPLVSNDIIKLVKLRNEIAKELGFNNYHEMSLKLSEQDPEEISRIFDELDSLTRQAYAQQKDEIDTYLAKKFNLKKEQLMPWNYQDRFFQEAPQIFTVDLDKYYKGKDVTVLTKEYYKSIGMDVEDIMKHSDLYAKAGKNQHAYCIDIDNIQDIRVLCNVVNDANWQGTLLHEFGHGVYDKYIDQKLPFTLRNPAHTFTTEAIAEMFGRFSTNPQWLFDMKCIDGPEKDKIAPDCHKTLRLQQLVFSRWVQVMYRFEKSMYENPDQDLNALWWNLVEKYQMIKRPENRNQPDWASKIHIATYPCYYHNYLLGELLASQLYYYITKNVIKSDDFRNQSFANKPEAGKYLIDNIFFPGARYPWNEMIEKATGEKLTAKYYARQFVN